MSDYSKKELCIPSEILLCLKEWLGEFEISRYLSGANNRGFIVSTNKKKYFLKYYPDIFNSKLRIQRELNFISFCLASGNSQVAKVFKSSTKHRCVLFEFIAVDNGDTIIDDYVEQAMSFVKNINTTSNIELALSADAAFTLNDFKLLVDSRFEVLKKMNFPPYLSIKSKKLLLQIEVYYQKTQQKKTSNVELPLQVIASPSDFGLHNALKYDNKYFFIDFEYAGKDSTWKFIADFFAQPQFPIPSKAIKYITYFMPLEVIRKHQDIFCFVYQLTLIKWCLLMLQTGFRLYSESNNQDKLSQHLTQVEDYFLTIDNKLELMTKQILAIR